MKAATTLLTLLSLSISSLAAPTPATTTPQECIVPMVIFTSITNPFTLYAANSGNPKIDGQTFTFLPRTGKGSFDVGLFSYGKQLNTTLASGSLVLGGSGSKAFIVEPKDRARFREVAFKENPKTPATYNARYACINGKPGAHVVLVPAESDQGLTFCVYPDSNKGGQYGLWVKAADDSSPDCVAITAVVNEVV
ncbi:hypothetical protein FN846DRAFT_948338 [Sphaerosporella brunnea]|uniref:Ubiquitin 3 binding protein But2 C-terminal domain-containing protein n=1 Tax=Sphaerosporella brunnea TaxID=1250544 RepID=A0A5J5EXQ8_9PEZI|nr:hypothetical protein FN846DRAFT_948338 [Sphaerosporella brunnea]